MAIPEPLRAGQSPTPNYAEQILDEVRHRILVEKWVLEETRDRRNAVLAAARTFTGALGGFGSGSLAHWTVNKPISDGDGGIVLDRRRWTELGPDSDANDGPGEVMRAMAQHVCAELRDQYPNISYRLEKRAILFRFKEPIGDVDPTVDLVLCLTRRDKPGFWIPNRDRDRWDPSDPNTHTELMTAEPQSLRVHRARLIRLAKAAIKNDSSPVLIPWNISALALEHVTKAGALAEHLAELFRFMASSIERRLTKDPAGVSPPIKLPDGISRERAVKRLRELANRIQEAVDHADDHTRALEALGKVFRDQLPEAPRSGAYRTADALRGGATAPAASAIFGKVSSEPRSFGDASQ
jgi:hypothetical protein